MMKGQMSTDAFMWTMIVFVLLSSYILGSFAKDIVISDVWENQNVRIDPPQCNMGLIIVDGLLGCAWSWTSFYYALFNVGSSIVYIQLFLLVPFFFVLGLIVVRIIRGGG